MMGRTQQAHTNTLKYTASLSGNLHFGPECIQCVCLHLSPPPPPSVDVLYDVMETQASDGGDGDGSLFTLMERFLSWCVCENVCANKRDRERERLLRLGCWVLVMFMRLPSNYKCRSLYVCSFVRVLFAVLEAQSSSIRKLNSKSLLAVVIKTLHPVRNPRKFCLSDRLSQKSG